MRKSKEKKNIVVKDTFHSLDEWEREFLRFKGNENKFEELALTPGVLAENLADDSLNRVINN